MRERDGGIRWRQWTALFALSSAALTAIVAPGVGAGPEPAESSAGQVVLGSKSYAPGGAGFGTVAPARIFNGGVPSGEVREIVWQTWGAPVATGSGLTSIYHPNGGYYPDPGAIQLRAKSIGRCRKPNGKPSKRRAYRRLMFSVVEYPGGPFGKWQRWSGTRSICAWKF